MKTIMPDVSATSFPTYGRRPVPVAVPMPRPATVSGALRAAARLIAANGHHQGDFCPDAFDRADRTPHRSRPLSIVAAVRCVVSSSPHRPTPLSELTVSYLASRLEVNGEPAPDDDHLLRELHVAAWGDGEGRTTEGVCAVLYAAADAVEVSA